MHGFNRIISRKKVYTYDQIEFTQDKAELPGQTVKLALEKIKRYEEKLQYPLIKNGPVKIINDFGLHQYIIECSPQLNNKYPSIRTTQGKGVTDIQARASCIMEFVERFSFYEYNEWKKQAYTDFNVNALNLKNIALSLNYKENDSDELIKEFERVPLLWGKAYNLITGREIYIPRFLFLISTTGLAAGNVLEEALMQAICECVERHSGAYVQWYGGVYPTIDKDSIEDKILYDLIAQVENKGFELLIKDFSGILGIPTVGVLTIDPTDRNNIGHGIGVCTDKNKALIRAVLESAQGFATVNDTRENPPRLNLKNITGSYYFNSYEEMQFLLKGEKIKFQDVIDIKQDDFKQEIIQCSDILRNKGKEIIFMDLTDSEIGFSVVGVYLTNAYKTYIKTSLPYWLALHQSEEMPDSAAKNLKKAEFLQQDKTLVYYQLGLCHQKKMEHKKAIEYFSKAIEFHPVYISSPLRNIYLNISESYIELKEYDKAIENLNAAFSVQRDNFAIYRYLGLCYEEKREFNAALKYFEKAVTLTMGKKELGDLYYEIGYVKKILGDITGSETAFKDSLGVNPEDETAKSYNQLAMIYIETDRPVLAIEILKQSFNYASDRWENYNLIGAAYRSCGDAHLAAKAFEKAVSLNPQEWKNYNLLGKIYFGMGLQERGREMLAKAIELCPNDSDIKKMRETLNGSN